jgi:hypothetical protein
MRRSVVALAGALVALACGGISVRHDGTDSDAVDTTDSEVGQTPAQNQPQPDSASPDESSMCQKVCARCMGVALGESCQAFCGDVISEAEAARCSGAFSSLLKCRTKADEMCALDACPTQDNALTACVLEYCDSHGMAGLCIGPL